MVAEAGVTLQQTPLHDLHRELGARMVPFAGYDMPVQYPAGIIAEHRHTRAAAGLFDVSHMGQAWLEATDDAAAAFETLVPGDLKGLAPGAMRYTLLLNEAGGIRDDLIATRLDDDARRLFLVVNAACKDDDFAYIAGALAGRAQLRPLDDRALLALQGPQAAAVMTRLNPAVAALAFMRMAEIDLAGTACQVSRSGYTGEDGFEISLAAAAADGFARALLAQPEVEPIGLGARDSLRLEAGLCLYGHDLDTTTTPVEADLVWTIAKHRRADADFPGGGVIGAQLASGPPRRRVGLLPEGRVPAREGTEITDRDGQSIGRVTSGGFGPTVAAPVAMGYVAPTHGAPDTDVVLVVRGKPVPARVVKLPFVRSNYFRGG